MKIRRNPARIPKKNCRTKATQGKKTVRRLIGKYRADSMTETSIEFIGFEDDHDLDELFTSFRLLDDYKSFLPGHLTDVLRKQHPNAELRSLELMESQSNCELGGMPSPENKERIAVDTMRVPIKLRIRLSTNGEDLHELDATLVIDAKEMQSDPQITSDLLIQSHRTIS